MAAREAKWVSAVKLTSCFAVIHVNSSLFAALRERILTTKSFPAPLFLVFVSQTASCTRLFSLCQEYFIHIHFSLGLVAAVVCRVRRDSFVKQTAQVSSLPALVLMWTLNDEFCN